MPNFANFNPDDNPRAAKPRTPSGDPPQGFIELSQGQEIILVQVAHIVTVQNNQLVMVTQGTMTCDESMEQIIAKINLATMAKAEQAKAGA